MTNKIYYFEIPDPEKESLVEKIKSILAACLGPNDDELVFFCDSKKPTSIFYAFWPSYKVEKIVSGLQLIKVLFLFKDITEEVLLGVQNNNTEFIKTFRKEEAKKKLNMFLKSNLTKDNVLDKIRDYGIESLTEVDREILEG